ncbi:CXXC motif containing zinc binding protein [Prorops nasuta]|uniref:CXXC motif containing zinc binding protein n=1 Tax=Prorops nasuta TaxID=863751 RepID=UPI0034CD0509
MVKVALQIKVSLENIEELKTSGPEFKWYFKFCCSNCGEISKKWNYVLLNEFTNAQRGNAVNHFVSKCKLCSRENTMTILEDSIQNYTSEDDGKFKTVATFDCRGIEPCDFSAREGWIAQTIDGGTEFTDVDLSEGTWADYCDKIKQAVTISDIEYKFSRIK